MMRCRCRRARWTKRLDAVIDAAVAEERIVGTVVMVAEHGEIVYARAAGFADREAGKPAAQDTIFRLASVTKPMVAAATLALVDAGASLRSTIRSPAFCPISGRSLTMAASLSSPSAIC